MTEPEPEKSALKIPPWLTGSYRAHRTGFFVGFVVLNGVNMVVGRGWWVFWPLLVWSFALAIHYLFYKTATVGDDWVDERAENVRLNSYDRSHMESISSRYDLDDPEPKRGMTC